MSKLSKARRRRTNNLRIIIMTTTLTARSICDNDCIFKVELIKRTAKTATIKYHGVPRRCKIHTHDGEEFIYALGQYSMAPQFKL